MIPLSIIPAPYRLLAQAVAVALLALAIYATGRSHGSDSVQRKWDAERLVQQQAAHAAEMAHRAKEQQILNKYTEAQNAAINREKTLAADAAAARTVADSLRNTVAAIRRDLPAAPAETCRSTADAALDVFGQCADRYQQLAAAADRHALDAQACRDAWPE